MTARSILLISAAVLVVYLAALSQVEEGPVRWLRDNHDVGVYYVRALFYPGQRVPYRDTFSEYPPLATFAFAIPMVLDGETATDRDRYGLWWSGLMALAFLATVGLVVRSRQRLDLSAWPALLMLGPSLLYFSLLRYDILCALLVSASLYLALCRRYEQAHLLLALGAFMKWYPALLLPFYLSLQMREDRSRALRCGALFLLASLGMAGLCVAWFTWDGFLVPYQFHAERGGQFFNPYWLAERLLAVGGGPDWRDHLAVLNPVFAALQGSGLLLLALPVRDHVELLKRCAATVYLFITFCRIDSPQWILWYVPVLLVFLHRPLTLALVALLGVLNYLVFPLGFFGLGLASPWFIGLVLVKDLALLALILLSSVEPAQGEAQPVIEGGGQQDHGPGQPGSSPLGAEDQQ